MAGDEASLTIDGERYELAVADHFAGPRLDEGLWLDHYLPHWTTAERSAARYDLGSEGLQLRIDADQPAWRAEDGRMRVSNIQNGAFSGRAGSERGTHRHTPGLLVRSPVPTRPPWTPLAGYVEATLRAPADPGCMLAIWLVGFEESSPADSGEITIAELFGERIAPERSTVRCGVKAVNDPRLVTDVADIELPIDAAAAAHRYGAAWNAERIHVLVDGEVVRTLEQGISYPLQLMIDLFEFPATEERPPAAYPKTALVESVRAYRPSAPPL